MLTSEEREDDVLRFPYREAVSGLMWTAMMARPDITCSVRAVARFWKGPGLAQDKKMAMKGVQCLLHTNK